MDLEGSSQVATVIGYQKPVNGCIPNYLFISRDEAECSSEEDTEPKIAQMPFMILVDSMSALNTA